MSGIFWFLGISREGKQKVMGRIRTIDRMEEGHTLLRELKEEHISLKGEF